MFSSLSQNRRGIAYALLGYTAFAFADANAKWLTRDFETIQIIAFQNGLASLLLIALAPLLGGWKGLWVPREMPLHLLRAVLNFLFLLMIVHSFAILPLAGIYTMIFAMPFFAVLLAMTFYGERVTKGRWAAILCGFAGVLIILRPGFGDASPALLLPLAGSFLLAVMFTACRLLKEASPLVLAFYPIAGTFLLSLPLLAGQYAPPEPLQWLHFALGAVLMAAGVTFTSLAFRTADASVVSPFLYTEMIWAVLFGYLLFGDGLDVWMIAGTGVIIASGLYIMRLRSSA